MSWVGLPGYDCGLCGAPSCTSAARLMEARKLSKDACPFATVHIAQAWIAQPSPVRVVKPCPSRPTLAEVVLVVTPPESEFRPLDPDVLQLSLPSLGFRVRSALRGQMVIGERDDLRVNAFITGKITLRSEQGAERARSEVPRLLRAIAPALVCQAMGLSEAEVAAGCAGPDHRLLCRTAEVFSEAEIAVRGVPAKKALEERGDVMESLRSMASLDESDAEGALEVGLSLLLEGDTLGLWLFGVALEVLRALKNDPGRNYCENLAAVLKGRDVPRGDLKEAADARERDRVRPALAALHLIDAMDVAI
ncbi:MAG TPA: hypothetical protein ENG69_02690 [Candidatus Korarchaeota archaeon]|nr:hypothetical protein [Candidatus Korarchaeota archaeon]